jgi:hypothetical protein
VSLFDGQAAKVLPSWGKRQEFNNEKSRQVLGIEYIEVKKSIIEMAYALIEKGQVEDHRRK